MTDEETANVEAVADALDVVHQHRQQLLERLDEAEQSLAFIKRALDAAHVALAEARDRKVPGAAYAYEQVVAVLPLVAKVRA
jgi:hypothetical protein